MVAIGTALGGDLQLSNKGRAMLRHALSAIVLVIVPWVILVLLA
jgi:hypothetical protein